MEKYMLFYLDDEKEEFIGTTDDSNWMFADSTEVVVTMPQHLLNGWRFNAHRWNNLYLIKIGDQHLDAA